MPPTRDRRPQRGAVVGRAWKAGTVRSDRCVAARPASSDGDSTRFFWSPRADRDLRAGQAASPVRGSPAAGQDVRLSLGPRDPRGPNEGTAGPQEREAAEAAHQGSDAAPARRPADVVRAAAGDVLGDAGFSIRCGPQSTSVPHRGRPNRSGGGPFGRARDAAARTSSPDSSVKTWFIWSTWSAAATGAVQCRAPHCAPTTAAGRRTTPGRRDRLVLPAPQRPPGPRPPVRAGAGRDLGGARSDRRELDQPAARGGRDAAGGDRHPG